MIYIRLAFLYQVCTVEGITYSNYTVRIGLNPAVAWWDNGKICQVVSDPQILKHILREKVFNYDKGVPDSADS